MRRLQGVVVVAANSDNRQLPKPLELLLLLLLPPPSTPLGAAAANTARSHGMAGNSNLLVA